MQQPEQIRGSGSVNARQQVLRCTVSPPLGPRREIDEVVDPERGEHLGRGVQGRPGQHVGRAGQAVRDAGGERAPQRAPAQVQPRRGCPPASGARCSSISDVRRASSSASSSGTTTTPIARRAVRLAARQRVRGQHGDLDRGEADGDERLPAVTTAPPRRPAASAVPGGRRRSRARPAARASRSSTSRPGRPPRAGAARQRCLAVSSRLSSASPSTRAVAGDQPAGSRTTRPGARPLRLGRSGRAAIAAQRGRDRQQRVGHGHDGGRGAHCCPPRTRTTPTSDPSSGPSQTAHTTPRRVA